MSDSLLQHNSIIMEKDGVHFSRWAASPKSTTSEATDGVHIAKGRHGSAAQLKLAKRLATIAKQLRPEAEAPRPRRARAPEQSEAAPAEAVATPTKQPLWNDGAWKETGDDSSDDGGSGPSVSAYRSFRAEQSAGSRGLWQNGRWQRTPSDDE